MGGSRKKVTNIDKHPKTIKFKNMNSLVEERKKKRDDKYNRFISECDEIIKRNQK